MAAYRDAVRARATGAQRRRADRPHDAALRGDERPDARRQRRRTRAHGRAARRVPGRRRASACRRACSTRRRSPRRPMKCIDPGARRRAPRRRLRHAPAQRDADHHRGDARGRRLRLRGRRAARSSRTTSAPARRNGAARARRCRWSTQLAQRQPIALDVYPVRRRLDRVARGPGRRRDRRDADLERRAPRRQRPAAGRHRRRVGRRPEDRLPAPACPAARAAFRCTRTMSSA